MAAQQSLDKQNTSAYWYAFLLCFLVLAIRSWARLWYPEFWAEDAAVFFADALKTGYSSLTLPFAGSFHTVQRLISLATIHLLPVAWWPGAVCLSCYIITAAIAGAIVRPGHAWIIPSSAARFAVALMLCFAAGLDEMLGNLANLNWIMLIWLGLLGLRDPRQKITVVELGAAVMILLSVGTAILLVPLFAWRTVNSFRDAQLRSNRAGEVTLLALIVVCSMGLVLMNRQGFGSETENHAIIQEILRDGPKNLAQYMLRLWILAPWMGLSFQSYLWHSPDYVLWQWVSTLALLGLTAWLLWTRPRPGLLAILLFTAGIAVWPVLNWIARPGTLRVVFVEFRDWSTFRYAYPLSAAAAIFWVSLLRPQQLIGSRHALWTLAFILCNLGTGMSHPWIKRQGWTERKGETAWAESAPLLEKSLKTGCPAKVVMTAYPTGWAMVYDSNRSAAECEKEATNHSP